LSDEWVIVVTKLNETKWNVETKLIQVLIRDFASTVFCQTNKAKNSLTAGKKSQQSFWIT
jgi:hypothetical protein